MTSKEEKIREILNNKIDELTKKLSDLEEKYTEENSLYKSLKVQEVKLNMKIDLIDSSEVVEVTCSNGILKIKASVIDDFPYMCLLKQSKFIDFKKSQCKVFLSMMRNYKYEMSTFDKETVNVCLKNFVNEENFYFLLKQFFCYNENNNFYNDFVFIFN